MNAFDRIIYQSVGMRLFPELVPGNFMPDKELTNLAKNIVKDYYSELSRWDFVSGYAHLGKTLQIGFSDFPKPYILAINKHLLNESSGVNAGAIALSLSNLTHHNDVHESKTTLIDVVLYRFNPKYKDSVDKSIDQDVINRGLGKALLKTKKYVESQCIIRPIGYSSLEIESMKTLLG